MAEISELRRVDVFKDLPDDQLAWFLSRCTELQLNPGDPYLQQGSPADAMFVVLDGRYSARGEMNGQQFSFELQAGDITGRLPFSRMKTFPLGTRTLTAGRVLRFDASIFPQLVQRMPELTTRLVGLMSDRIRETTRLEQQRDRLAALGKLSAGLAHELNNPASAAKRATSQLRDLIWRVRNASVELGRRNLNAEQKSQIERLEETLFHMDGPPPDPLTMSDLEDQIDSLLRSHGQNDMWQLAADLAKRDFKPAMLEQLFASLDPDTARAALVRISTSVEIFGLLKELESSATRISDLVGAIKEYTYMDQSPVQNVDIIKTLEATLTMLNHKLKKGITVQRDYQKIPLLVNSFGSELNQVWTNLIDNAIDAMKGQGELRVKTYREDDCVVVEIDDNGPGISDDVLPHIFEPFFTTKQVGEGTGLGLDTVQRIVKKHHGNIEVESVPGNTRFQVWLPISQTAN
jgi:signal transduction histidine kinase